MATPFHEGEQRVQTRLGVREEIEPWARRVVRSYLPDEHRAFYAQLPFLVLAARDETGRPWATLVAGEPGFVASPDPDSLQIGALPAPGDALLEALQPGVDVGLLGIELETRRRNRVNGRLHGRSASGFGFSVEQSFGNCPQHITARAWQRAGPSAVSERATRDERLSQAQADVIARADTFFIATGFRGSGDSETFGMDASHRGGSPGFVRIDGPNEITFPDYAGNNHFNTLGNLLMDPRAGLLFVDFERGDMLQLTGRASIDWESEVIGEFSGARRLVHFEIEEVVALPGVLPLRWEAPSGAIRELRVIAKQPESADVTSFVFAARDSDSLADFVAGQYLPVELEVPGESAPVRRTYSLSGTPGDSQYRISVKREPRGLASRFLHDHLKAGDFIKAGPPQGEFVLDESSPRPVVLVAAGVGVTPLASMLCSLSKTAAGRRVWLVHGVRDGDHHPLGKELRRVAASSADAAVHVAYSRPGASDQIGRDYDTRGRVDVSLLAELVPGLDADFYLCGPAGFMTAIQEQLEARGVPRKRVYSESFGPS